MQCSNAYLHNISTTQICKMKRSQTHSSRRGKRAKQDKGEYSSASSIFSLLYDATIAMDATQFSLDPDILPAPLPTTCCNFELPAEYMSLIPGMQQYRNIKRNIYRGPIVRQCCDPDDVPTCSCLVSTGCDHSCDNRLVFM